MMRHYLVIVLMLSSTATLAAGAESLLQGYAQQSGRAFSGERGRDLWQRSTLHAGETRPRSCTTCHGSDLTVAGKHASTGKAIPPMSRRAHPEALTDSAKIEKWLTRNCKWTLGRECTLVEKGDVLSYLLAGGGQ